MTGEMTAHRRMTVMILDVLRDIAAESGTGHIGSEHVALLAIRGSGGLAQLTGLPPDRLATALRRPCRLAGEIPLDRPTATTRTVRMVRSAIALAEMRGEPTPTAAELVGALLSEPGCEAWIDMAPLGVTEASVERAQGQAFERRRASLKHPVRPPSPREGD